MNVSELLDLCRIKAPELNYTAAEKLAELAREEFLNRTEYYYTLSDVTLSEARTYITYSEIMENKSGGGRVINVYNIMLDEGNWNFVPENRFGFRFKDEITATALYKFTVTGEEVHFNTELASGTVLKVKYTYIPYQESFAISDIPSKWHSHLAEFILMHYYQGVNLELAEYYRRLWEDSIRDIQGEIKLQTSGMNIQDRPESPFDEDDGENYVSFTLSGT